MYALLQLTLLACVFGVFGLPVAGYFAGLFERMVIFFAVTVFTVVALAGYWFLLEYVLTNGLYPGSTGMEGLGAVIVTAASAVSFFVSLFFIPLGRAIRKRRTT